MLRCVPLTVLRAMLWPIIMLCALQGLDEALLSMNTGSIRRLYIPGSLAFPKGLASAPGRHVLSINCRYVPVIGTLRLPALYTLLKMQGDRHQASDA